VKTEFVTRAGFQGIITSLLGYGFYHVVDKPLKGWQYMILMISIVSIILGIFIGWWMPDSPTKAKCFSEEDKLLLVERVRANDQGIKNVKWIPAQMREAFTDPVIYMLFFAMVLK
jgi:sugar phosphate permease